MKTSELIDQALAWAVAVSDGNEPFFWANWEGNEFPETDDGPFRPDLEWSQGGPIIEREKLTVGWEESDQEWLARGMYCDWDTFSGPTPLIAAMRCYVASKLGDEVEIPEKLK